MRIRLISRSIDDYIGNPLYIFRRFIDGNIYNIGDGINWMNERKYDYNIIYDVGLFDGHQCINYYIDIPNNQEAMLYKLYWGR